MLHQRMRKKLLSRKAAHLPRSVTNERSSAGGKREARAREWRIANLAWLVDFAYGPHADVWNLHRKLGREFLGKTMTGPWERMCGLDPNQEIPWLQERARKWLESAAKGERRELRMSDLVEADSKLSLCVDPLLRSSRGPGYIAGNCKAIFEIAMATLLGGPDGDRVVRCAEPNCGKILIKRKQGRYCALHGSGVERARRLRLKLKSAPLKDKAERARARSSKTTTGRTTR
jgi:hypothetical protein